MAKKKKSKNIKNQITQINSQLNAVTNRLEGDTFIFQNQMTIREFAKAIKKPVVEIIKIFFNDGIMMNQNTLLTENQIGELCLKFNLDFKKQNKVTVENLIENFDEKKDKKSLVERSPVVTIMGHVDHGKTTLLDKIRDSDVASSEHGGITQHIGAYEINTKKGKTITFIDTPGHEIFSEMRARGSQITDIVVIVVAADDGIKPQTIEAIDHAKAAKVPIIVFVNKMDKPNTDFEKIMHELSAFDLMPEEWGGDIPYIKGSAIKNDGIENLLENILVRAEIMELKTSLDGPAKGIIIESTLDKFLGPSASLIVQSGTLKVRDYIVAGFCQGRIRTIKNDRNEIVEKVKPSTPVRILGLNDVPKAGDYFMCFYDEKLSKKIANARKDQALNKSRISNISAFSLENFNDLVKNKKEKVLRVILKADTFGSIEALKNSFSKVDLNDVKVDIIRNSIGSITDTDITLAMASNAVIYGFNVRKNINVNNKSFANQVEIRLHNIIYEAIDDIKNLAKGMIDPSYKEEVIGQAEIRKIFKHSKIGKIAGCLVLSGWVSRNSRVRIIRNDKIAYTGEISNLKHEKEEAKEIKVGKECGITIKNFNDIKIGDIIEAYSIVKVEE